MESSGAAGGALPSGAGPQGTSSAKEPTYRAILRVVVTVVLSAFALYIVYLLRTPLFYLVFAIFIAVAVSGPVNRLSNHMPRGGAIALVYAGVVLIPVLIGAILIPPAVRALSSLVSEFPTYVQDLNEFIRDNEQLQSLTEDFDLTQKLEEAAQDAASKLDDAAAALADIGAGIVGSLFATFIVLIMSIFIVARGRRWIDAALRMRPEHEAQAVDRAMDRMAAAVGGYIGGALAQATLAGIATFIVLTILGVPSPLALAVIVAVLDLIPLVGATIGAIIVGVITLFTDFPTATIVWAVFAIVYQQFENYVVQPRIQARAVDLDPFIVVIAALFGGTLMGVVGALVAIPSAAAMQIGIRELMAYRRSQLPPEDRGDGPDVEGPAERPEQSADPGEGDAPLAPGTA